MHGWPAGLYRYSHCTRSLSHQPGLAAHLSFSLTHQVISRYFSIHLCHIFPVDHCLPTGCLWNPSPPLVRRLSPPQLCATIEGFKKHTMSADTNSSMKKRYAMSHYLSLCVADECLKIDCHRPTCKFSAYHNQESHDCRRTCLQ
jgi:hypothetical protein